VTIQDLVQAKILKALQPGAQTRHEISDTVGITEIQAMRELKNLREAGRVRLTGFGAYEHAHGGYWPGPGGVA